MLQKSSQLPKMKRIFEIPWGKLEILDIRRSFFTLVTLLYNSCGYIWWGCRTLFWHEKFTFILYHYRSPTWDFKNKFFVDSWDDFGSIVRRIVAGPFFCYPTIMALNKNTSISTNYVPNLMVSVVRFNKGFFFYVYKAKKEVCNNFTKDGVTALVTKFKVKILTSCLF